MVMKGGEGRDAAWLEFVALIFNFLNKYIVDVEF